MLIASDSDKLDVLISAISIVLGEFCINYQVQLFHLSAKGALWTGKLMGVLQQWNGLGCMIYGSNNNPDCNYVGKYGEYGIKNNI